ncbi:MAG: hypothetical protein L6406_06610 [Desulfobacterales bacterium]|nr:hypothetical protein [Desulfobacterales bacterium]
MKGILKDQIKKIFPGIVLAYHEYRNKKYYRRMQPKRFALGFQLIGSRAMQDGTFEPLETDIIRSILEKSDVFIDIGANVGYFACLTEHHPQGLNPNFLKVFEIFWKNGYEARTDDKDHASLSSFV